MCVCVYIPATMIPLIYYTRITREKKAKKRTERYMGSACTTTTTIRAITVLNRDGWPLPKTTKKYGRSYLRTDGIESSRPTAESVRAPDDERTQVEKERPQLLQILFFSSSSPLMKTALLLQGTSSEMQKKKKRFCVTWYLQCYRDEQS